MTLKLRNLSVLFILGTTILLLSALSDTASAFKEILPGGELIYPGVGIDTVRIGEPLPSRLPPLLEKSIAERRIVIHVEGSRKAVERITVLSPDYALARSQIRARVNTFDEVLRYYGSGIVNNQDGRQTVQFPTEGMEFVFSKRSGRIEAISVFSPLRPKIRIQQYRILKDQFKQSR